MKNSFESSKLAVKKVCLISLGCPKNLVDAEMMLGFLKKDGFELTINPEEAHVLVVNTCGFVADSKKESIDKLLNMAEYKKTGRCEVLVASGCLTQRYSQELADEMPEVDLLIGLGEFHRLPELIRTKLPQNASARSFVESERLYTHFQQILPDPDLPRILATPRHYSYLKISEGCSHRCSFCAIPHIRGRLKSRPISSIVREVQMLLEDGVKEFNLIAQDLNEYGKDLGDGSSLTQLIQELDQLEGEFWLRPHYMYPLEFTDRLIETLKESDHVVKYVDMPLQHISERILRSMRRGSPSRYVRQVLTRLKTAMPDIAIRTTFIVGYPGETKDEFSELLQFLKEFEFDHVGAFQYSPEEGTEAALLPEEVSEKIRAERYHQLMTLQQKISLNKNRSHVGKIYEALCEQESADSSSIVKARIYSQAPEIDGLTFLSGQKMNSGEFVKVKMIAAKEYDLIAEVV